MKLKNVICFLIVIGFLSSCEKNDSLAENFPITLYASEITQIAEIKMWVDKKEINDNEKKLKFIENANCFNLSNRVEEAGASIIFLSKDSVVFGSNTFGFTVQKQDNQFLFYSPLDVIVTNGDIVHPLLKYTDELKPIYEERYITREIRVAYGSYANLELCFLAYKLAKNTEYDGINMGLLASGTLMNEFNNDAINSLQATDTLAIQEYKIRFTAK
ncbi:MAG: hypothetical protein LBT25_07375 [Candidatus Symbiothrix sp.]|jgi:hypothetical protein|nr:hypothetical protein [Candidatus Symbiothrix sp.]